MSEIYPEIKKWMASGQETALATVVQTWGSSPRAVGAKMAVNEQGELCGSVSGGCVEGAVVDACLTTLEERTPDLLHFGVADETAWEVGLACGGKIDVFVQLVSETMLEGFRRAVEEKQGLVIATVITGPAAILGQHLLLLGDGENKGNIDHSKSAEILSAAEDALKSGKCQRIDLDEGVEVFIDVMLPPSTLVIVGGVHIAVALVKIAKAVGYQTIIIDPRRQFGSQERFPGVDQLIQEWPVEALADIGLNSGTAVAVLTHDPKIDDPALIKALPSAAFYVGALGSQKTQSSRRERLLAEGVSPDDLARLRGPIGLDLGGRSPEEIALAIMAEIIQVRYQ